MIKVSVRLGGYLELNFRAAAGAAGLPGNGRTGMTLRLPRNEVSALLNKDAPCTVESPDRSTESFVIREVRPGRDWIELFCVNV